MAERGNDRLGLYLRKGIKCTDRLLIPIICLTPGLTACTTTQGDRPPSPPTPIIGKPHPGTHDPREGPHFGPPDKPIAPLAQNPRTDSYEVQPFGTTLNPAEILGELTGVDPNIIAQGEISPDQYEDILIELYALVPIYNPPPDLIRLAETNVTLIINPEIGEPIYYRFREQDGIQIHTPIDLPPVPEIPSEKLFIIDVRDDTRSNDIIRFLARDEDQSLKIQQLLKENADLVAFIKLLGGRYALTTEDATGENILIINFASTSQLNTALNRTEANSFSQYNKGFTAVSTTPEENFVSSVVVLNMTGIMNVANATDLDLTVAIKTTALNELFHIDVPKVGCGGACSPAELSEIIVHLRDNLPKYEALSTVFGANPNLFWAAMGIHPADLAMYERGLLSLEQLANPAN